MLTCIPLDRPSPGNADADVRSAFGPVAHDRLMEAVDSYLPTPDVTTPNPPPNAG